jgi:hypothetical protein
MKTTGSAGRGSAGLVALSLLLGACAGGGVGPAESPAPEGARGVPGFDTRDYPGDAAMAAWREASPYRWVGFYLPAPCYTGTSWQGKREAIEGMGWGTAVLFVGEQDWAAGADSAALADAGPGGLRCTRENLSPERGRTDGRAAATAAAADGFPAGTVVYLDVEPVDSVSSALAGYVRGWTEGLIADGRFAPALYAHERNADALLDVMAAVAGAGTGAAARPRLWVARTGGFSLRRGPAESGFDAATIWQGLLDVDESWGGVTLRIDANVAETADPSR